MSHSTFGGFFTRRQTATTDIEDFTQTNGINQTDFYGFQISLRAKDIEDRKKCDEKGRRRSERWMRFELERTLPSDKTKLKQMIRKGVPYGLRSWVWMETSGARAKMEKLGIAYYRQMLEQARESSSVAKQIELDVPRTFPGHEWLESLEGQRLLENVLLAYSMHNPNVGYCQSMNYIAAMMLLVLGKKEDKAFFMLMTLIEDILYDGVYEPNLRGCQTEMKCLAELLHKKLPKLYKVLDSMHCEMSMIATDWFLCLFSTSLSSEVTARIWDSLFHEGPKIIFRISVAILSLAEHHLLHIDNPGEMLKAVKIYASNIHNRDKLMKIAFDGIGSLSMVTIDRLRITKRKEVDEMIAKRSVRVQQKNPEEHSKWDDVDLEESAAVGSDGKSSIATAMSGFSVGWKDLPDNYQDFEFN